MAQGTVRSADLHEQAATGLPCNRLIGISTIPDLSRSSSPQTGRWACRTGTIPRYFHHYRLHERSRNYCSLLSLRSISLKAKLNYKHFVIDKEDFLFIRDEQDDVVAS
jgi:hypothetical protein